MLGSELRFSCLDYASILTLSIFLACSSSSSLPLPLFIQHSFVFTRAVYTILLTAWLQSYVPYFEIYIPQLSWQGFLSAYFTWLTGSFGYTMFSLLLHPSVSVSFFLAVHMHTCM